MNGAHLLYKADSPPFVEHAIPNHFKLARTFSG
jgi:hypothetical protein